MNQLQRAIQHPVARVLGVFLASRLMVVGILFAARATPLELPGPEGLPEMLCRFDCTWYLRIVDDGYTTSTPGTQTDATPFAFFPLYPLLIQAVSVLPMVTPLTAGLLISNVAAALGLVYVYYYTRDLGLSHGVALTAVSLLSFGPPSFVFSAVLTEGLFLLLLAAAVFHLRRNEYGRAALAAALLSAARPTGIAFVAFALVWIVARYRRASVRHLWLHPATALPLVAAPLGLFAFWTFSFVTTGDAFAHVAANLHGWGWGSTSALETLVLLPRLDPSDLLLTAVSALTLALSLLVLRQRLLPEFALIATSLVIIWTGGLAPWSMPRFALVLFPLAVAVATLMSRRKGTAGAVLASAAMLNSFLLIVGWALELFVI
jgi:hypothetical protein